jgi:hypothetical protein
LWQLGQPALAKTLRPLTAALVKAPLVRSGLGLAAVSDFTYAASASRSALRPTFGSPSGWLRVPAL